MIIACICLKRKERSDEVPLYGILDCHFIGNIRYEKSGQSHDWRGVVLVFE